MLLSDTALFIPNLQLFKSLISAAQLESFQPLVIFWPLCLLQLQAFISNLLYK